ncbi:MAG: hypothetical protein WCJ56_03850 [bacterium]
MAYPVTDTPMVFSSSGGCFSFLAFLGAICGIASAILYALAGVINKSKAFLTAVRILFWVMPFAVFFTICGDVVSLSDLRTELVQSKTIPAISSAMPAFQYFPDYQYHGLYDQGIDTATTANKTVRSLRYTTATTLVVWCAAFLALIYRYIISIRKQTAIGWIPAIIFGLGSFAALLVRVFV